MKLVDVNNEAGNMTELEASLKEAVTASAPAPDATAATPESPDNSAKLTGKLEGKSLEDIASMYSNLESAYGRMANDLGTQRKLTDRLLDLKRSDDLGQNTPETQKEVNVSSTDLLDNPKETLDAYFESRMAQLQQGNSERMNQVESSLAEQNFTAKHGDISRIGEDPQFGEYVNATPLRQDLAQKAAAGDYAAADTLLDEWKSVKSFLAPAKGDPTPDPTPAADPNLEAARQASLESSTPAGSASSGKTYRRADLIELKLTKPHIYSDPAFQEEIVQAYLDKRVK